MFDTSRMCLCSDECWRNHYGFTDSVLTATHSRSIKSHAKFVLD